MPNKSGKEIVEGYRRFIKKLKKDVSKLDGISLIPDEMRAMPGGNTLPDPYLLAHRTIDMIWETSNLLDQVIGERPAKPARATKARAKLDVNSPAGPT